MRFSELLGRLTQVGADTAHDLASDPDLIGAQALDQAGVGQLSFLEAGNALAAALESTQASAVLIPIDAALQELATAQGLAWVALKDPRLGFAEALEALYPSPRKAAGIHPSAVVAPTAVVGSQVHIGARVVVGEGSQIGDGCVLHAGAVLYEDVELAAGCEIHSGAVLHPGSRLAAACVVHSNAVIGSEGFGFVPTAQGWRKMPQTGQVVLEEAVEVGCGTTIDRPCVGETRIGSGTKIDNQVHIGHDVWTGSHCVMAAQVGIAGGSRLGNHVILAGQVGLANRTLVGDRVTATSKSGLHGSIPANSVMSGYPAIDHKLWLRCSAAFTQLPKVIRSIKGALR